MPRTWSPVRSRTSWIRTGRPTPGLAYVVIVGGDNVIPFFRYADEALLGPESGFIPPVLDTSASDASLRLNYVLSQDAYGAKTDDRPGRE